MSAAKKDVYPLDHAITLPLTVDRLALTSAMVTTLDALLITLDALDAIGFSLIVEPDPDDEKRLRPLALPRLVEG